MKTKQAEIYDSLVLLSVILNQPQDVQRLKFYVEALKEFESEAVLGLIRGFPSRSKFFPQLVELIEPLRGLDVPGDELANIIAAEIIESISRFGSYQEIEARQYLGEKFQLVDRSGGWKSLCQIELKDIPSTKAQLRDLAKAYINRSKREGHLGLNAESRPIENRKSGLAKLQLVEVGND